MDHSATIGIVALGGSDAFLHWHLAGAALAAGRSPRIIGGSDDTRDASVFVYADAPDVDATRADESIRECTAAIRSAASVRRVVHITRAESAAAVSAQRAREALHEACLGRGVRLDVIDLGELFGEPGSVPAGGYVDTICRGLTSGDTPVHAAGPPLALTHAQDVADLVVGASPVTQAPAHRLGSDEVLARLVDIHQHWQSNSAPPAREPLTRDLFHTYHAYATRGRFVRSIPDHRDSRGSLIEVMKSWGGESQTAVSTTHPGHARAQHFHRRRVERVLVIAGTAEVRLRRLDSTTVETVRATAHSGRVIDIPTLWAHELRNAGSDDLVIAYWTDAAHRPGASDTYPVEV